MSSVVKSVGRAVSGVVKGAVNVVKGAVNGVSKLFGNGALGKIAKVALVAAAIYFGGAALVGSMGGGALGMGATAGGLEGAAAGISQAWGGLTSAVGIGSASTATAPATTSMGGAGGLSAGAAGETGLTAGASGAGGLTATPGATAAFNSGISPALQAAGSTATLPGAAPAAASIWSSPYTAPAAIAGGTAIIGGVMQGKAMEDQRNFEVEQQRQARERYGSNVGTRLWGSAPTDSGGGGGGASAPTAYQSTGYDSRLSSASPAASNMQQVDPVTGQPVSVSDLNRRSATAFNDIWQRPGLIGNYAYMNPSRYG